MSPGNSSWLPWTSSELLVWALPLLEQPIHTGSDDQAKGPPTCHISRDFAAVVAQTSSIPPRIWYFVHIFNQIELGLQRLNDSPRRNPVTPPSRAAALRSTALATSLAL